MMMMRESFSRLNYLSIIELHLLPRWQKERACVCVCWVATQHSCSKVYHINFYVNDGSSNKKAKHETRQEHVRERLLQKYYAKRKIAYKMKILYSNDSDKGYFNLWISRAYVNKYHMWFPHTHAGRFFCIIHSTIAEQKKAINMYSFKIICIFSPARICMMLS
jgi:hypothetical protein